MNDPKGIYFRISGFHPFQTGKTLLKKRVFDSCKMAITISLFFLCKKLSCAIFLSLDPYRFCHPDLVSPLISSTPLYKGLGSTVSYKERTRESLASLS